jgi:glyoxylase I family protein
MIHGIHHIAISTGDMERALRFYRDLLGFEVAWHGSWPAGTAAADRITALEGSAARQVMLRSGNAYVELFEYTAPAPRPGDPKRPVNDHGITHLCFDVTDLEAEYERLTAAGIEFHCPPEDLGGGVRTTYARDPDGNVVELQELASAEHRVALPAAA